MRRREVDAEEGASFRDRLECHAVMCDAILEDAEGGKRVLVMASIDRHAEALRVKFGPMLSDDARSRTVFFALTDRPERVSGRRFDAIHVDSILRGIGDEDVQRLLPLLVPGGKVTRW